MFSVSFLFAILIAGVVLNTVFLVREIRRNERQDSFLNAVTHELKTPIASMRLYLDTLQRHPVDEPSVSSFYATCDRTPIVFSPQWNRCSRPANSDSANAYSDAVESN